MGYDDIREGLKNKDYGQVALGAGFMLPSVGGVAKGIQGLKIAGVSGKAAKVSKKVRGKSWKDPRTWGPFGLIAGGALTARDAEAEPGVVFTETDKEEIWQVLKTVAKDTENATEQEINQAIEIWENQKT